MLTANEYKPAPNQCKDSTQQLLFTSKYLTFWYKTYTRDNLQIDNTQPLWKL